MMLSGSERRARREADALLVKRAHEALVATAPAEGSVEGALTALLAEWAWACGLDADVLEAIGGPHVVELARRVLARESTP